MNFKILKYEWLSTLQGKIVLQKTCFLRKYTHWILKGSIIWWNPNLFTKYTTVDAQFHYLKSSAAKTFNLAEGEVNSR